MTLSDQNSAVDELGKSLNMIIKTRQDKKKYEGTKFNSHATLLVEKKMYIAFAFSIYAI